MTHHILDIRGLTTGGKGAAVLEVDASLVLRDRSVCLSLSKSQFHNLLLRAQTYSDDIASHEVDGQQLSESLLSQHFTDETKALVVLTDLAGSKLGPRQRVYWFVRICVKEADSESNTVSILGGRTWLWPLAESRCATIMGFMERRGEATALVHRFAYEPGGFSFASWFSANGPAARLLTHVQLLPSRVEATYMALVLAHWAQYETAGADEEVVERVAGPNSPPLLEVLNNDLVEHLLHTVMQPVIGVLHSSPRFLYASQRDILSLRGVCRTFARVVHTRLISTVIVMRELVTAMHASCGVEETTAAARMLRRSELPLGRFAQLTSDCDACLSGRELLLRYMQLVFCKRFTEQPPEAPVALRLRKRTPKSYRDPEAESEMKLWRAECAARRRLKVL